MIAYTLPVMGSSDEFKALIYNAAWFVRYYQRNDVRRKQAILKLGAAVRHAFNNSSDYEGLLATLVDALNAGPKNLF